MKKLLLIMVLIVFSNCVEKEDAPSCDVNGLKIPDGENSPAPIGECAIYSCQVQNKQQSIQALTCPEFGYDPSKCFKIPMNLSLQYPDCCPQVKCNNK
ncbi:venom peptide Pc-like [Chrysoperla carnea]|uniref:venom peptide Pc-like n=1 Tax=Chrysoperla carnea TaxID=189513 RepID=UPI001D0837A5|nr:venom peptide Pc-like [Chrysoperla carnea]